MKKIILLIIIFLSTVSNSNAQRIKDLAYFKGISTEQLIGYGLVVGLAGTGDSHRSSFTIQSITSMLKRFGITVPETNLRTRNVAAVMITAKVNNLYKEGTEFDVVVSSMGDATSLMGATLLMTPLSGADGSVYGIAQGPISIGGFDINTGSGGRVAKNHALSGRIPGGGKLEAEIPGGEINQSELSLILREPDFTTLNNVATAINQQFGDGTASAEGASEVRLIVPNNVTDFTSFISQLESIEVQKDVVARVVLNERTGTVVTGSNVRISPVTISHGSLNISIQSFPLVSQPNAFSQGETVLFNNLVPNADQESGNAVTIDGATNVQEVAAALNSLNVSPRDIIAVFQALKEAGALTAELIII